MPVKSSLCLQPLYTLTSSKRGLHSPSSTSDVWDVFLCQHKAGKLLPDRRRCSKCLCRRRAGQELKLLPNKLKCSCLAVCASVSIMTSDDDFADEEDFTDALLGEQPK